MLGNGLSTSPSNSGLRAAHPLVSIADNVLLQRRLLRHLGVARVALTYGYSMGAMQALHYAAMFPDEVERVLAACGTASCHHYNAVFLEGLIGILKSDPGESSPRRRGGLSCDAPPSSSADTPLCRSLPMRPPPAPPRPAPRCRIRGRGRIRGGSEQVEGDPGCLRAGVRWVRWVERTPYPRTPPTNHPLVESTRSCRDAFDAREIGRSMCPHAL